MYPAQVKISFAAVEWIMLVTIMETTYFTTTDVQ